VGIPTPYDPVYFTTPNPFRYIATAALTTLNELSPASLSAALDVPESDLLQFDKPQLVVQSIAAPS